MAHPEEPTLPEDTGQRKNKNMEELMKMIVRRTALAVCTLVPGSDPVHSRFRCLHRL